MKITNIKISILETPGASRIFELTMLPGMRRPRWIHGSSTASDGYTQVMHVETDEGVTGICTVGEGVAGRLDKDTLDQMRAVAVGEDALAREMLYQKLHTSTRWVYRQPGWGGTLDNCLWDIAGKAANLPVHALIGRVRDSIPMYFNIRGETKEEASEDAIRAVEAGFPAVKDHFYHPVDENIEWFRAIRDAVGPDIDIMHDPVGIYSYEQAVRVGRELEDLAYRWIEEPLPERQHNKLKQLCDALDIPVLAPEMMMFDVDLSAQWLISGATDMIRGNARHGTTSVLKLAHLAELHGTTVELNAGGRAVRTGPRPHPCMYLQHLVLRVLRWGQRAGREGDRSAEPTDSRWRQYVSARRPRLGSRVGLGLLQQEARRRMVIIMPGDSEPCG